MIVVITPPYPVADEELIVNRLFENGLHLLHLRKLNAEKDVYERFIQKIEPCFRERIIVHDYFDLVESYGLKGIHLKSHQAATGSGIRTSVFPATPSRRSPNCRSRRITCF